MRRTGKAFGTLAAATSLALMGSSVAFADVVQNDVTSSEAGKVKTITAGGSTVVNFRVLVDNTDSTDRSGCNVGGGDQAATLSISVPAGASVDTNPNLAGNQTTVSVINCGIDYPATFSSSSAGRYQVTVDVTGGKSGSVYNETPATFTLAVEPATHQPPANTAPSVAVAGVTNGASYEIGSVPTASCTVVDAEDTDEAATPVVSAVSGTLAAYGLGSQAVSCSYTDKGDPALSDSDEVTYAIVDTGAPVITDLAASASPDGASGWYISAVLNKFLATDSGAGFQTATPKKLTEEFSVSSGLREGSAVAIASGSISDVAGNAATSINSAAFKIDLTNPTASFDSTIGSVFFGSVPAAPTCTSADGGSGPDGCSVTGYSTAVGTHTLTATAKDVAGRTGTATQTYEVKAWTFSGFYQPVDMSTATTIVYNTVKGGGTVPLKFEIFAGTTELTDAAAIKPLTSAVTPCSSVGSEDAVELTATGGTSLRYDTTAGQYVYNWQTPKTVGSCYKVTITSQDGSSKTAYFKTK